MDYETEEQQLEAIKKWWNDNAAMIISGLVIGVASIFGWQYYQDYSIRHKDEASILYETVLLNQARTDVINEQQTRVNQLSSDYSDTPYASLASLILAKQHIAAGEIVQAQQLLQWVVNNTNQTELAYIAKIRLARVLASSDQVDQALLILNEEFPQSFQAMAMELKGDLLVTKGEKDKAREAYTTAMTASQGNPLIQLKIDDLGESDS